MHLDQISTTLLYFSPLVIKPSEYCFSYSSICFFVLEIKFSFVFGIIKSSLPKDIPALNACLNPKVLIINNHGIIRKISKNKKSFIANKIAEIVVNKLLINDRNFN